MIGATTGFMQFSRSIGTALGATVFGVIVNHGLPVSVRGGRPILHRLSFADRHQLADAIRPGFLLGLCLCAVIFLIAFRGVTERPLRASFDDVDEASAAAA
jgi:hypothetical protein